MPPSPKSPSVTPKRKQERRPSPIKSDDVNDAMQNLDIDEQVPHLLQLLDSAQSLIDAQKSDEEKWAEETSKLPVISPGETVKKERIGFGFRVDEIDDVQMSSVGDIKVVRNPLTQCSGVMKAIVMQYELGFSWCYWTYELVGQAVVGGVNNKTLAECLIEFGTGIQQHPNGIEVKGIWLNQSCRTEPSDFFIVSVMYCGQQIQAKGQEEDSRVFRVFRSSIPGDIKDAICLYQSWQVRNQRQKTIFWEM